MQNETKIITAVALVRVFLRAEPHGVVLVARTDVSAEADTFVILLESVLQRRIAKKVSVFANFYVPYIH